MVGPGGVRVDVYRGDGHGVGFLRMIFSDEIGKVLRQYTRLDHWRAPWLPFADMGVVPGA